MSILMSHITKRFPGVVALEDVSVEIAKGSCHGLVGENGAGKSTLGKILAGLYHSDEGSIALNGKSVRFSNPHDAVEAGISMVHQELLFCENLSVAENLCLGDIPSTGPFVDDRAMLERARGWLSAIGAEIDPKQRLGDLPVSKQQLVQIAAGIGKGARILIFDEPTSSLSNAETQRLMSLIKDLKIQGITCIYVSHRLEEIFELCDAVTVLRDGRVVDTRPIRELTKDSLVRLMIGREVTESQGGHQGSSIGEEALKVENLTSPGLFQGVSFVLRRGEILGCAGLVGAGRTEVTEALFGLNKAATGSIWIHGSQVRPRNPQGAMRFGMGLVPEDRKRHGLVLSMNAKENVSLPTLGDLSTVGLIQRKKELSLAKKFFDRMRVKAPTLESPTAGLSGGNQQKLVLAKWLAAESDILIIDEPTRGVDVGAKAEIHNLLRGLAGEGKGVLLISSELPELLTLSNRILVMRQGQIVGEVPGAEADEESVMRLMAGVT